MPTDVVLLIPGFFGYNAFGPAQAPILEYFAGVRQILQPALPNHAVLVHEPPPTGSLDERVASLHESIWRLMRGQPLAHAAQTITANRVHLVGHSTGGVDAWLLANRNFHWVGGPRGSERAEIIAALGEVVTVSAPFRGTPLVSRAALVRDVALGIAQQLTLLGTWRNPGFDSIVTKSLAAIGGSVVRPRLRGVSPSAVLSEAARQAAASRQASTGAAEEVAVQVRRFLREIEEDRQLFDDLSVVHMAELSREIRGGDDLTRIHSYVTASPKPTRVDVGFDLVGRAVYDLLYHLTAHDRLPGAQPDGKYLGTPSELGAILKSPVSCDGVVPTRSQTLDGRAKLVVLADHLDVVGSFRGGSGADVMRSGSNFSATEFAQLWSDIAFVIDQQAAVRPPPSMPKPSRPRLRDLWARSRNGEQRQA